jgi:hypothetical protein
LELGRSDCTSGTIRGCFFGLKAFRRALFALPCIGILVAFYLSQTAFPAHYMLSYWKVHHKEIAQHDDRQILIGLSSGVAMLFWCIVFGKDERLLARVGWFLAILGIFLSFDIRLVD